jgi:hypothetical protein
METFPYGAFMYLSNNNNNNNNNNKIHTSNIGTAGTNSNQSENVWATYLDST